MCWRKSAIEHKNRKYQNNEKKERIKFKYERNKEYEKTNVVKWIILYVIFLRDSGVGKSTSLRSVHIQGYIKTDR